ncbi:cbb3-type cytochrome oxidase assembly protein CcoS [Sediminicola luteus]|uniref:Cytochrome oxidase maturation protein, cbb3-type n=1 Tax=Sediminicola luteus TaxID=319238 RepID=A0A2A4GDD0_9FLAO|nr:cbb3-type cytochrome oxidase assembly protein CcoS [Sediminicola luteus]PCE65980.1 cytochrome oxidase maturation protein, cbb3-type [Sediminicola luteus]
MSVIYLLLAVSITVAVIFFAAFVLSVRSGQYDDSYTPSVRMLFDDELVSEPGSKAPAENPKNVPANSKIKV